MARWGRNGSAVGIASIEALPPKRLGRRAMICLALALGSAAAGFAAFMAVPADAGEPWQSISVFAFIALFLCVAPAFHVAGAFFGVAALFNEGDNKIAGVAALLLNTIALLAGALLVWAGASSIASFT